MWPPVPRPLSIAPASSLDMEFEPFVRTVVDSLAVRMLGAPNAACRARIKAAPGRKCSGSLAYFLCSCLTADVNSGEWAEFGVHNGASTLLIANGRAALAEPGRAIARPVHGFDSFRGLPEDWVISAKNESASNRNARHFSRRGQPPMHDPARYAWHVGWFNETVPPFARELAARTGDPAARRLTFLHMDADLYSSSDVVLRGLEARVAPSAYLVFDELINYPRFREGEMRALYELWRRSGRALRVHGFTGPQVSADPKVLELALRQGQVGVDRSYPKNAIVQLV